MNYLIITNFLSIVIFKLIFIYKTKVNIKLNNIINFLNNNIFFILKQ